jgi:capsular polysaccharide transport system permease protein
LLIKLFYGSITSGINAIDSNQGLLVYPSVRPLDLFIARFIYELMTIVFSFALFCIVGMFIGIKLSLANLDILGAAYLLAWLMGCGCGLILGVLVAHVGELEKVVRMLQTPLMFISAVVAPVSAMPESTQKLLLMNPLVHPIELSRHALFPNYHAEGAVLSYPFEAAIILVAIGLVLFRGNRSFLSKR